MSLLARLIARAVAAMLLLFWAFLLFTVVPLPAAQAQDAGREDLVPNLLTSGGVAGLVIQLLGIACLVCTLIGLARATRPDAWPHWRRLVRGLGEAAFLIGVVGSFTGMRNAMGTVATLGAAVTAADMAGGIAAATATIIVGGWVALLALVGASLIRWRQPRHQVHADTFS